MKSTSRILMVALILSIGISAGAHHSFSGSYILSQTATVEGTIVQFGIRNPHSFVNLEAKDADGKIVRWGIEWGGITLLTTTGVSKETLKVGDKVSIIGAPSRDPGERKILMQKIHRVSDGWTWGDRPEETIKGYPFNAASPAAPVPNQH